MILDWEWQLFDSDKAHRVMNIVIVVLIKSIAANTICPMQKLIKDVYRNLDTL